MTQYQTHYPYNTTGLLGKAHSDSRNDREIEEQNVRHDRRRTDAKASAGGDEEE